MLRQIAIIGGLTAILAGCEMRCDVTVQNKPTNQYQTKHDASVDQKVSYETIDLDGHKIPGIIKSPEYTSLMTGCEHPEHGRPIKEYLVPQGRYHKDFAYEERTIDGHVINIPVKELKNSGPLTDTEKPSQDF
jgi:hypothetical protein